MSIDWKEIGETYVGDNPGIVKVRRLTVGVSSALPDVVVGAQATVPLFTVPAGCLILGCATRVSEAFTASVTLIISDSDSAVWSPTATIAPQSTGVTLQQGTAGSIFDATGLDVGKIYDAAQVINVVVGAADAVVGKMDVFVKYVENGLL